MQRASRPIARDLTMWQLANWGAAGRRFFRGSARLVRLLVIGTTRLDGLRLLTCGYLSYILAGWLLLSLPVCHQAAELRAVDHLFVATSAVSTTGLTPISTSGSYSFLGEVVVLLLFQFGGLGYMTISSCILLAVSGQVSPLRQRVSRAALSLPPEFDLRRFLRLIVAYTLAIETAGALALYPSFAARGAPQPAWQAVFHSVSAFCTAGFGLFDNSLEDYRSDTLLNVATIILSYLGAVGFIVLSDLWSSLIGRKPQITMTSRVILWSTLWISAVGTVLFVVEEPALRGLPAHERWMVSLFQVMTASTTVGFNTIPMGALSGTSVYLLTVLMVIGASPAGTGGGLKTTTFSILWAEMVSVLRRRRRTTFFGHAIPEARRRAAVANVMLYTLTLALGTYLFSLADAAPLSDQLFECTSALGTVGLSRGITGSLSTAAKLVLIALMFVGRLGPVAIGMALFSNSSDSDEDAPAADIIV